MTTDVAHWIEGYRRAWESNAPDDIRSLFTEDADYRTEPWAPPWHGHDEIVENWIRNKDEPGAATFEWFPLVVTEERAIVQGVTAYVDGRTYSNLWVIEMAPDGRAWSFTEWWMDQSNASEAD